MMNITENYQRLRRDIPEHVTIVLAAKTRTPDDVLEVIAASATDIGENYVQEAETMQQALGDAARSVRWHMIGALQTNKINKALPLFDVFQTIDSLEKAQAFETRAARFGRVWPVYLEVNIAAETSKAGMPPEYAQIEQLARHMAQFEHLRVEGIMTMGMFTPEPEDSRPYFRAARQMFDRLGALDLPNVTMKTLSMGMSDSYQVAIEEGANMVRLGTIVFGARQSA